MTTRIRTYCSLCGVGCPSVVTVDGQRVVSLEPDRDHPQGGVICGKGRAASEIHDAAHRVNYPLRRTRPKTAADPGWERISWDEALSTVADRLTTIRSESGAHAVAFGRGTGSGTGLSPTEPWIKRLAGAFGSPNYMTNTHLCNWARDGSAHYTFGVYPMPPPDVAESGCIILWGSNPSATLLSLATGVVAARTRGAKLVVIDPRRVGLANKADLVLQVRPGTDAALALAFIQQLLEAGSYDDEFVRRWTNAPLLVRADTGRLLLASDVESGPAPLSRPIDRSLLVDDGDAASPVYVAMLAEGGELVRYEARGTSPAVWYEGLALRGRTHVGLRSGGTTECETVLERLARSAATCAPDAAAEITGVPAEDIRAALRLIVENHPVSHHSWNGIVQHTNATQAGRAIAVFYSLLGDWDRPGGNVVPAQPLTLDIGGVAALTPEQSALRLGRDERPLGPPGAPPGNIAAYDLYDAILDGTPYRMRGLLSFGGNTLMNTGDTVRGREALQRLEFFAQAELFHTPTSDLADILLPAASFLESEMFIVTAAGTAQRRRRSTELLHERRPDVDIIFDLATRLGLGAAFAGGSVAHAYDQVLAPAGLTWDALRNIPDGAPVAPAVSYKKYAAVAADGRPMGFATPTGLAELFVDDFAAHGQPGVPVFEEPFESPRRTPGLAATYPIVLTNAKRPQYLHSQHRGIPMLRRLARDPTVEIHPDTAARYGIADRAWVMIETPRGRARARADVTAAIGPGVACANHGWWEACEPLGLPALDPFSDQGANVNLLVTNELRDPISGGVAHRSAMCRLVPIDAA